MIKENVLYILKFKNLNQKYLIEKAGICRQTFDTQMKSDNIGLQIIVKYASLLNVPAYYLLLDIEELKTKLDSAKETEEKSKEIIVICPKCKEQIKLQL